jgi:hypothetical protein
MTARSLGSHLETKEMQIDAARVIILTPEEKKWKKDYICIAEKKATRLKTSPRSRTDALLRLEAQ